MEGEPAFKREGRWLHVSDEFWSEMCHRLLAKPQTNFAYWDEVELEILELFAERFEELQDAYKDHVWFQENWGNVLKAIDHVEGLYAKFELFPCRQFLVAPLREPRSLATEEDARKTMAAEFDPTCPWASAEAVSPEFFPIKQMIRNGDVIVSNQSWFDSEGSLEVSKQILDDLKVFDQLRCDPSKVKLPYEDYKRLKKDPIVGDLLHENRYNIRLSLE